MYGIIIQTLKKRGIVMENETKQCKYCLTEIPKKAKICPNCKKKQGGGCLPKIGIVLVILVVLGLFGGGEDESGTKINNSSSDSKIDNVVETSKETETADDGYVQVGGSFEIDGLKVTVNDCDLDYTDYDDEYGWYTPEDGMKYIRVSFTYENSHKDDKYVSIYDYDCYADNTLCEESYNFGGDFINANLSEGRNVSFETFYVVPVDSESIELEYTENIWTNEKVMIKLQ